jgi:restriction endonuclease S subunit
MTYKLTDIIKMKSGVFAKGDTNPDVYYIQSTDFDSDKKWVENLNPVLRAAPKLDKHILDKGDILFAAKGREFFAVVYDGAYAPAVASTTFLVLQVKAKYIVPEYVAWFLNHAKSQTLLWNLARGTAISSITISTLEQLEIPIPTLSKQNSILEFSNLQKQETKLQQQIMNLKQEYLNELTYKSIQ